MSSTAIWHDANQLLLLIRQAVKHFPKHHKYTLGSEMRLQAMLICHLVSRAWHNKPRAQRLLPQLVDAVDDLVQWGREINRLLPSEQFAAMPGKDICSRVNSAIVRETGHLHGGLKRRLVTHTTFAIN